MVNLPRESARRQGGFQPPHCPHPSCAFHRRHPHWRFVRNGHHVRKRDGKRIQDFRCSSCGRRFCASTFTLKYWLRRPELLAPIATLVTEGAAFRQAARVLGISPNTVARHVARLGRHCLLLHHALLRNHQVTEPLVFDGFETFEHSQFFPFHVNLGVGAESWFVYHFTHSPLRRKGRMTKGQKRKRAELEKRFGRPDPKAVEHGAYSLLGHLLPKAAHPSVTLHSDDHPAYRRALRRLRHENPQLPSVLHKITSSKARRTQDNPLFPVNLADLLLRHGSANHRRETIAFSKRCQSAMERVALFTVWRNYVKKRREKESWPAQTAAMRAGVLDHALIWREILKRRLFPASSALPKVWKDYYWKRVRTLVLGNRQSGHDLKYAF